MHLRSFLLAAMALPLTASIASTQTPLQGVLSQLDTASARFKNAQADVKYDNFTKVVHDDEKQTGTIFLERNGNKQQFGAVFFNEGQSKTPDKVINYDGGTLHVYSPATTTDDVFKAGANQGKYESFLTLGFGGSGKALDQAWNITDQGSETIAGVKTEKLDLVSKDPSVANTFKHVTIWIDPTRSVSLKQIFYAPNGDTRTAEYSNIKLNSSVDKKPYEISKKATPTYH